MFSCFRGGRSTAQKRAQELEEWAQLEALYGSNTQQCQCGQCYQGSNLADANGSAATGAVYPSVHTQPGFGGQSQTFEAAGLYTWCAGEFSIGNDAIQSIRVPKGWKVTAYEHCSRRLGGYGNSVTVTEDTPQVGGGLSGKISALKIEGAPPAPPPPPAPVALKDASLSLPPPVMTAAPQSPAEQSMVDCHGKVCANLKKLMDEHKNNFRNYAEQRDEAAALAKSKELARQGEANEQQMAEILSHNHEARSNAFTVQRDKHRAELADAAAQLQAATQKYNEASKKWSDLACESGWRAAV